MGRPKTNSPAYKGTSVKIDAETYKIVRDYHDNTGLPIVRILRNAVQLFAKKTNVQVKIAKKVKKKQLFSKKDTISLDRWLIMEYNSYIRLTKGEKT